MWQQIQKFGPKYSDLSTMISNVNILTRVLGLSIDNRLKKPIPLAFYIVTTFCTISHYYANLFSMVWFVFYRSQNTGDATPAMIVGSLGVTSLIATFKLFYMIVHASKVRSIIDQCLDLDTLSVPHTRFTRNMGKVLRNVKIRALSLASGVVVLGVWYNVAPVFLPGKHLPEDSLVYYGLEPVSETPNYQITYFITTNWVAFIAYICITTSSITILITGYIEAQMLSLSEEILSIWEDSIKDTARCEIDDMCILYENKQPIINNIKARVNLIIRKRLIHILQSHSRNVTLLRNINNFFNIPNAIAIGCLGICLIAALLGGLESTYLQIPFMFLQVAMDCFTGQKIMNASVTFGMAVYSCNWEKFDKDNMKIVLLILRNSQRTLSVTAGGMAVLNYSLLMSIVNSVYSAYTTLRSMF